MDDRPPNPRSAGCGEGRWQAMINWMAEFAARPGALVPGPALQPDRVDALAEALYDDLTVTEVIRPAAVLAEPDARRVLDELRRRSVECGGGWDAEPGCWRRYETTSDPAGARGLIGSIQVAYGMPTRYEITIFRATITVCGSRNGYTVTSLCDEALGFTGLTLATCPRVDMPAPPKAFRFR